MQDLVDEHSYKKLIERVWAYGQLKKGRNGNTISLSGQSVKLDLTDGKFPIITGRKMYYKGVIGEALAFMQTPCNHISDFESRGCNYWKKWADEDGNLALDYPIYDKLPGLIKGIINDPGSRRHIIDLWDASTLPYLSLPCCHYSYQFIVYGDWLDMIWTQRSADIMIGVPSDMILAAVYTYVVAQETGLKPRFVTMNFGDAHIYEEHLDNAQVYRSRPIYKQPMLKLDKVPFQELTVDNFHVEYEQYGDPIKFELKE
jgi:thymidylate synthase